MLGRDPNTGSFDPSLERIVAVTRQSRGRKGGFPISGSRPQYGVV